MREVDVESVPIGQLAALLPADRAMRLRTLAAHERVLDEYVGDRYLERWADLFVSLDAGDAQEISARDLGRAGP